MENELLYQSGVKGMKWGVRKAIKKYQDDQVAKQAKRDADPVRQIKSKLKATSSQAAEVKRSYDNKILGLKMDITKAKSGLEQLKIDNKQDIAKKSELTREVKQLKKTKTPTESGTYDRIKAYMDNRNKIKISKNKIASLDQKIKSHSALVKAMQDKHSILNEQLANVSRTELDKINSEITSLRKDLNRERIKKIKALLTKNK